MNDVEEHGSLVAEKDIPHDVQLGLIKRRTERGMKPDEIARLMGIDVTTVKALVVTNGWTPKREVTEETTQGRPAKPSEKTLRLVSELTRLAKAGHSRGDIGAMLGIDRGYVDTLCRRYQIRTAKNKDRVAALYGKGWTQQAIADELGVSRQRVNEMIRQYGIKKGAKP